jgi:hypothetical protein
VIDGGERVHDDGSGGGEWIVHLVGTPVVVAVDMIRMCCRVVALVASCGL